MEEFAHSRAVVIGINSYQDGIHSLRTPVCDATALAVMLRQRHGYAPIYLRREKQATLEGLRTLLYKRLPRSSGERERLLFYFAGHGVALPGASGPEGFLLPQDARRDDRASYLPMQEVSTALADLGYHHLLVILDCCFAGAFSWVSGRETDLVPDTVLYRERFAHYVQSPTWQVLTSAWYNQRALDVADGFSLGSREDGSEHSPFAAQLLAALEGKADVLPAPDGDGVILASELIAYLEVGFAGAPGVQNQTPMLWRVRTEDSGQYMFLNPVHPLNLPPTPPLQPDDNPYPGLKSFTEEDKELFFGRELLAAQLAGDVGQRPLTIVVGASGAGKTSLVQAGLLPRLRANTGVKWQLLDVIRPGTTPLRTLETIRLPTGATLAEWCAVRGTSVAAYPDALGAALQEVLDQQHADKALLVIDQLEELFTLGDAPTQRDQFLQQIVRAMDLLPARLHVVFTLRSDFEPQFDRPDLRRYWQPPARFVVPLMSAVELRQVIVKPAAVLGLRFDPPDLVDEIIAEVVQMPGALPLLSFTLSEMFLRYLARQESAQKTLQILDRTLTRQDYQALGGVIGAIRRRAESLYEALDPVHRRTLRRLMLRMVAVDHAPARRRVYHTELVFGDPAENERVAWVLQRLQQERLVVTDADAQGPYYEPGHDALVLSWPRLSSWIREEQQKADSLTFQRRMTQAAQEWEGPGGGEPSSPPTRLARLAVLWRRVQGFLSVTGREQDTLLWSSAERTALLELILVRATHWMNALEVSFAEASVRLHRNRRRFGLLLVIILTLLSLGVSAAAVRADLQRRATLREQSRLLSTLSEQQLTEDPVAAIKLALAALPSAAQPRPYLADAEFALSRALQASLEAEYQEPAERIVLEPVEIAHNQIALADDTGLMVLPYLPHLQTAATLTTTHMTGIAWNPVYTSTLVGFAATVVTIWQDGQIAAQQPFQDRVLCAVWHPAGDALAVCAGSRLWLWQPPGPPEAIAVFAGKVQAVQWSPQGQWLAAYDDSDQIVLWDHRLRQMVAPPGHDHRWATQAMAWSADEEHVVSSARGSVHVWSVHDGLVAETTHGSRVGGMIFDSGTLSNTFLVWGQNGPVTRMALDGTRLYTYTLAAGEPGVSHAVPFWDGDARVMVTVEDGQSVVWNLAAEPPAAQPLNLEAVVDAAAWNPPYLATGDKDNRLQIWDTSPMAQGKPPRHVLELFGHSRRADTDIVAVAWRRGATTQLLSISTDGSMRVWDVFDAAGRPLCADGDREGAPRCSAHYHRAAYTDGHVKRAHWLTAMSVAALREDCKLVVWTVDQAPVEYATEWESGCEVAWSPANDRALVYSTDPDTPAPYGAIYDLASGIRAWQFSNPIRDARWLEAGLLLSEQVEDRAMTRWIDPDQPLVAGTVLTLSGDLDAVDATGDLIAAPGVSNTLTIIDTTRGMSTTLPGSRGVMLALAWHSNGNILVSMANVVTPTLSTEVLLWNVADRAARPIWESEGQDPRSAIAVASDVSLLAVVTNTLTTVLDMVEGEPRWRWDAHGSEGVNGMEWITQAEWRGRGRRPLLLTWSGDGTARVWDVAHEGEILRLTHTTGVEFAAANPEGSAILTIDEAGVLHIWQTWWKDRTGLVQLARTRAARLLPPE